VFIELPGPAQHLSGLGLTLLMLSIGLLIAPSMLHRIAEREKDSQTVLALATLLTRLCFPFGRLGARYRDRVRGALRRRRGAPATSGEAGAPVQRAAYLRGRLRNSAQRLRQRNSRRRDTLPGLNLYLQRSESGCPAAGGNASIPARRPEALSDGRIPVGRKPSAMGKVVAQSQSLGLRAPARPKPVPDLPSDPPQMEHAISGAVIPKS
jgi:hypothetical protein